MNGFYIAATRLFLLLTIFSSGAYATERITHFNSNILIQPDRSMLVTETIDIIAENVAIKHGIYREFPTVYPHPGWGSLGFREKTGFKIRSIKVDGVDSPWHLDKLRNGVRFYIGDPNNFVSRGAHRYEIQYVTRHQIYRTDDIDFLDWNVNGQSWMFPGDKISATIHLPNAKKAINYTAWTGKTGSHETAYKSIENRDGSVTFSTTRILRPFEGLTISLQLPPGLLPAPDSSSLRFLIDNIKWIIGLLLLLAMPVYYLNAWRAVGRDPEKGVVVADYHPVRKLSAAAHRFITTNKVDNDTFTAALLGLAVKGYIRIQQQDKNTYTLYRQPAPDSSSPENRISPGEALVLDALLTGKNSQITLGKKYSRTVATSKRALGKYLKKEWRDAIYMDNRRYSWPGLIIGLVALTFCGMHLVNSELKFGHLIPLFVFIFAGIAMTQDTLRPFLLGGAGTFIVFGLQSANLSLFSSPAMLWLSLVVAGLFALFNTLLKAPTPFGQKILDEIEGFRLYLSTAEQHRLNILHPPQKTPALFEQLLPYAIALGVENNWSDQFSEVFKQQAHQNTAYQPDWYSGTGKTRFSSTGFGSALSSGLSNSVSSASTAPSSSSSSSGGGGAGGGGGGGGGGGW